MLASHRLPDPMLTARSYLATLAVLLVAGLTSVVLFNWLMNPYGFFNPPRFDGFNAQQNFGDKMRLRKAVQIYQQEPRALILGSSRSGRGFRCTDWPGHSQGCYNASLQAITSYETFRMLQHASSNGVLEAAVWELNFHGFFDATEQQAGFVDALYATPESGIDFSYRKQLLHYYLYALVSPESIDASWQSFRFQDKAFGWFSADSTFIESDGSWGSQPVVEAQRDPAWYHEKKSRGWNFALQRLARQLGELKNTHASRDFLTTSQAYYFEQSLDFLYRHHVATTLILSSGHLAYSRTLWQAGLGAEVANWKRFLVQTNERIAAKYSATPFPIMDFYEVSPYTTEADWNQLPPDQAMQWFADPSHFNEKLGHEILKAAFSGNVRGSWYNTVNSQNIEQHLRQLEENNRHYFPEEVAP